MVKGVARGNNRMGSGEYNQNRYNDALTDGLVTALSDFGFLTRKKPCAEYFQS